MKNWKKILAKLNLLEVKPVRIGLDLGSLYTRAYLQESSLSALPKGKKNTQSGRATKAKSSPRGKLVFDQPTCLLIENSSQDILSFGNDAYKLRDKLPPDTKLLFPVQQGQVAHESALVDFLKLIGQEIGLTQVQTWLGLVKGGAAVPAGSSKLERKILSRVLSQAGFGALSLEHNLKAVFQSWLASGKVSQNSSLLILDLGAETIDLGVFIDGQLTKSQTLSWGTNRFTELIKLWLKRSYQLAVSDQVAQAVQRNLPDLFSLRKGEKEISEEQLTRSSAKMNVRGVDLVNNLVLTKTVELAALKQEFQRLGQKLVRSIELILSEGQIFGLVEAFETGLYLTGGGSQLSGLSDYLAQELQTQAVVSSSPYFDTVRGLV